MLREISKLQAVVEKRKSQECCLAQYALRSVVGAVGSAVRLASLGVHARVHTP
jgi:hypothetical protein